MTQKSRFWEAAIRAVATERTLEGAADKAKVSLSTLHRWRKLPGFSEGVKAEQARIWEATGDLHVATGAAVLALREIVETVRAGPMARLQAARTILETSIRLRELDEVEGRLAALEAVATRTGTGGPRRVK